MGSVKRYFSAGARFGRSRSSKVIHVGTNRKRVCDFLLVRQSNFGPILHRFVDIAGFLLMTPPLLILAVFLLNQIADVGVNPSINLKLFGREIIFRTIPTYVITVPHRHGRTDRPHTVHGITVLCIASRGKHLLAL